MGQSYLNSVHGYLQIEPNIAACIEDDIAHGRCHPLAFRDENIQRRMANPHDEASVSRTAFGRDIEKIINIPAYNRYADKTQVFSFVENDDICRRGLHVQLVSRIARNIGRMLGLNTDLIEAIALGHDTGHTPFGHAGERFLSECYHAHTGRYFNHNVHSVRVLDELYRRNISLQTLDGALCHNGEFAQQVLQLGTMDDFDAFDRTVTACLDDEAVIATLRPSTLEGCVVRVSDMIAYLGKDRADAFDMGVISSFKLFDSQVLGTTNAQIISNMTTDIINSSYGKNNICMSPEVFADVKTAKRQNMELIYLKEGMVNGTENIVQEMFAELYEELLADLRAGNEHSPLVLHHVANLVSKSRTWTPESYLSQEPNQIVVDYLASMTDSYFMALYRYLFPQRNRKVFTREYCSDLPPRTPRL